MNAEFETWDDYWNWFVDKVKARTFDLAVVGTIILSYPLFYMGYRYYEHLQYEGKGTRYSPKNPRSPHKPPRPDSGEILEDDEMTEAEIEEYDKLFDDYLIATGLTI